MPNLSGLKAEIQSVKDIGKITNAMQLVASAKLRRIGKKVVETHEYVSEVYGVFNEIIKQTEDSIFLLKPGKEIKKTLWVVVNSNLGLCGGYNNNVNKLVMAGIKENDEIFAIGNKAVSFYKARKIAIRSQITNLDINFSNEQAREIGQDIMSYYTSKEFDEIKLVYTKFINNVTFEPTELTLFPIKKDAEEAKKGPKQEIQFEPSPTVILEATVNLYLNTVLFGTIVESQVSEQASRRTAMENATNNGEELSKSLSLKYNRERQGAITQEISEIVSGANAQQDN
ncbi:F0F1 ATP synthase subunit gamma [Williamsoniiplasma somnilux]|uniref:ATP synthase gamma chain n=1 Tax=Williamsoniiplasma somnilux TaxID=215578 RepID=A0A2K8P2C5_9MOLU|nr:ATP synthase F1 subunit gamma [Williamsoniiplasma somnilux]ATZ19043.1 F0F1 ATP synthase subunit gamma [Williamsoniiplasma somnilux]